MKDMEPKYKEPDKETLQKLLSIMVENRVEDLEASQKSMENLVKKLSRAGYKAPQIKAVLRIYGYRLYHFIKEA